MTNKKTYIYVYKKEIIKKNFYCYDKFTKNLYVIMHPIHEFGFVVVFISVISGQC